MKYWKNRDLLKWKEPDRISLMNPYTTLFASSRHPNSQGAEWWRVNLLPSSGLPLSGDLCQLRGQPLSGYHSLAPRPAAISGDQCCQLRGQLLSGDLCRQLRGRYVQTVSTPEPISCSTTRPTEVIMIYIYSDRSGLIFETVLWIQIHCVWIPDPECWPNMSTDSDVWYKFWREKNVCSVSDKCNFAFYL